MARRKPLTDVINDQLHVLQHIESALKKLDSGDEALQIFWSGIVRSTDTSLDMFDALNSKYFRFGLQEAVDLSEESQQFIEAAIKHESTFLKGISDNKFESYSTWLIELHKIQSYKGIGGKTELTQRVSNGEHSGVASMITTISKKYNDPYTSQGVHIVNMEGIDEQGWPRDEWQEDGTVRHFYPPPEYFDQYLLVLQQTLETFISQFNDASEEMLIDLIAHYYRYGINMHMFDQVNQSLFANQANALLKLLGYKPLPHGALDFLAMRMQKKSFHRYFRDLVTKYNT